MLLTIRQVVSVRTHGDLGRSPIAKRQYGAAFSLAGRFVRFAANRDGFPPAWFSPGPRREYGHGPEDSGGAPTCILRLLIAPPHRNSRITGGCKSRPEGRHPALGNPCRFPYTNAL